MSGAPGVIRTPDLLVHSQRTFANRLLTFWFLHGRSNSFPVPERPDFAQRRSPLMQAVEVLHRFSGRLNLVRSWIEETHVMHNVSIQKAIELPPRLKSAVDHLRQRRG